MIQRLIVAIACSICIAQQPATAQARLEYQERPYAFEGIKPRPVSGFDIELLSATAERDEKAIEMGDYMRVRFFLDVQRQAHLVVREIEQRMYYWLDRPKPGKFTAGYNSFTWPTTIMRRLPGLQPSDLGVVVRLDREEPGAVETIALASWSMPDDTAAKRYVFVFKLREDAQLRATIFDEPKGTPVFTADLGEQRGGRPFLFRWDLTKSTPVPGAYRLVIKGYILTNNDPVSQMVRFIHPPVQK